MPGTLPLGNHTASVMAARAMLTMGIKYGTGDVIAQQAASGAGGDVNRQRAGYFWAFGTYYGLVNYTVFRALAHSPWPVRPWPKALFSAICDGLVHVPLSFYPQFYFVREVVLSGEQRSASEHFSVGLSKYRQNLWQDVAASAAVFVPVGIINFRYVPLVWRTPFCSAFGLLFPIIVSWQRGAQVVDGS